VLSTSLDELKANIRSWKKQNPGDILTLEALWQIASRSLKPLTLDRMKKNGRFLDKKCATEAFLQRDKVFAELQDN